MNSRERVVLALNHQQADRVPLDLGGSVVTGMHASAVYRLRQGLGLDAPGTSVKVIDSFQLLGEIGPDLMAAARPAVRHGGRGAPAGPRANGNWRLRLQHQSQRPGRRAQ